MRTIDSLIGIFAFIVYIISLSGASYKVIQIVDPGQFPGVPPRWQCAVTIVLFLIVSIIASCVVDCVIKKDKRNPFC